MKKFICYTEDGETKEIEIIFLKTRKIITTDGLSYKFHEVEIRELFRVNIYGEPLYREVCWLNI